MTKEVRPKGEGGCDDPICQAFDRGWNAAVKWMEANPIAEHRKAYAQLQAAHRADLAAMQAKLNGAADAIEAVMAWGKRRRSTRSDQELHRQLLTVLQSLSTKDTEDG